MLIALPVQDGKLCMHFGHCGSFTMIEADEKTKKVLSTKTLTPPPHEPGVLPKWLSTLGVNLVIAGGMGQRAQDLFSQSGIKVIVGAPAEEPDKLVLSYMEGTLKTGTNVCDH